MASVSTIISLVPFPINEFKPQMDPEYIKIPAAEPNSFVVFHVASSGFPYYVGEGKNIRIPEPSESFAESIVNDYKISQVGLSEGAAPGLFYVEGKYSKEDVKKNETILAKILAAKQMQIKWFENLVRLADDDWAKTRQHALISDLQRHAARTLNVERDWMFAPSMDGTNLRCPACTAVVPNQAVVCPNCRCVLDSEKAKALSLAFVKG